MCRLVGGPSQNGRTGRVEIRHKGVWGTVCEDNFSTEEAKVVCRMLGFPSENARVYNGTTYYQGDGPVWIRLTEDKSCIGNETNISDCKEKHLWEHDDYCNHVEDVAVSCEDEDPSFYTTPAPAPVLPQNNPTTPADIGKSIFGQQRFVS